MIQIIKNVFRHFHYLPFRTKRDLVAAMVTLFFAIAFPIGIALVRNDLISVTIVLLMLFPLGIVLIASLIAYEANIYIETNVTKSNDKLLEDKAVE